MLSGSNIRTAPVVACGRRVTRERRLMQDTLHPILAAIPTAPTIALCRMRTSRAILQCKMTIKHVANGSDNFPGHERDIAGADNTLGLQLGRSPPLLILSAHIPQGCQAWTEGPHANHAICEIL